MWRAQLTIAGAIPDLVVFSAIRNQADSSKPLNRLRETSCGEAHSKSPGKKDRAEVSDSPSVNAQREPHRVGVQLCRQTASVNRDDQEAEVG